MGRVARLNASEVMFRVMMDHDVDDVDVDVDDIQLAPHVRSSENS